MSFHAFKLIFKTVSLCIFTIQSHAETPTYSWLVSDLLRSPQEQIKLKDEQDRLLQTISTKQIVYLYAAMNSITEVAETQAEFIIITGILPNAFAGLTEDGNNFIAINFAMLDILDTNMNMAAALIGHELAHLKLRHGETSKKNIEFNRGKEFSAANTRYSRDNERDADYLGTIWSVEAGYDPKGAVTLQEDLYTQSKKVTSSSFNVSHPSSIERITVLKSLVRRLAN
jgi:predicted Zn-dependent protease